MFSKLTNPLAIFNELNPAERRNIVLYICGLLFFKFVLESMSTCFSGIVLNRLSIGSGVTWANMQGVFLVSQAVGSLTIGPFVKRFHAKNVLCASICGLVLFVTIIPILEGSTGGRIPGTRGSKSKDFWGSWSPYWVYPIYGFMGFFIGMIELIRRVIPSEIVGSNPVKLRIMDGTVHAFWECIGTIGALFAYIWVGYFGWGFCLVLLPVGFSIAFGFFFLITPTDTKTIELKDYDLKNSSKSAISKIGTAFYSFGHSVVLGGQLVLTQRSLIWLIPGYTLPLILHRYLEGSIFPFWTKAMLNNTDVQSILNGGSNFGEMLGGITVVLFSNVITTPIPYLRLDAVFHLLVWVIPFFPVNAGNAAGTAWSIAPVMALISFAWSAGDTSLIAYIQSRLSDLHQDEYTTPLGAVMGFLYICNLAGYYVLNLLMSRVRDDYVENKKSMTELFVLTAGVAMSVVAVVVLFSTFIPKGSFAWNPRLDKKFDSEITMIGGEKVDDTLTESDDEEKTKGPIVALVQ